MASSPTSPRLGWIGLGSMGLAMATNIQKFLKEKNLPGLQYTNRTLSRGDTLKDLGASPCDTVADVVKNTDIIFISLSDDLALISTICSIVSSGELTGKIFVDTTTVHPNTTSAVSKQVSEAGGEHIISDAHVLAEKSNLPASVLETLIEQNLFKDGIHRARLRIRLGK
ncbi:hypothetical protein CC80DRAFT_548501 [Byssothecium circinans]|uniref:6-phosphogluconate dehydrogenase NADP-binding domain-containing protein n=1 Tax=Byssothecium circinans TaxID=147558 RepID=A0A6A5TX28_9PLEO|nr:hypothetical protein CC80DRAFT_548501 [Byssothecium circinans]